MIKEESKNEMDEKSPEMRQKEEASVPIPEEFQKSCKSLVDTHCKTEEHCEFLSSMVSKKRNEIWDSKHKNKKKVPLVMSTEEMPCSD